MKHRKVFAVELKRQIIKEPLSGMSTSAQLTRRYEVSSGLLYHWKKQYAKKGGSTMNPRRKPLWKTVSDNWNNWSAN